MIRICMTNNDEGCMKKHEKMGGWGGGRSVQNVPK